MEIYKVPILVCLLFASCDKPEINPPCEILTFHGDSIIYDVLVKPFVCNGDLYLYGQTDGDYSTSTRRLHAVFQQCHNSLWISFTGIGPQGIGDSFSPAKARINMSDIEDGIYETHLVLNQVDNIGTLTILNDTITLEFHSNSNIRVYGGLELLCFPTLR